MAHSSTMMGLAVCLTHHILYFIELDLSDSKIESMPGRRDDTASTQQHEAGRQGALPQQQASLVDGGAQHRQSYTPRIRPAKKRRNPTIIVYCIWTCLSCLYLETQCFYPLEDDLAKRRTLTMASYVIVGLSIWSYVQTIRIGNKLRRVSGRKRVLQTDDAFMEERDDAFMEERCEYCDYFKPARVSHCRQCGQCTMKMDHHCIWAQNCIGFRNQKAFYLFCFYMTAGLLQFWAATYHAYSSPHTLSFSIWVQLLSLCTCLSAFFVGIMILVLFLSHTAMVLTNHTTLMSLKNKEIYPLPFCQHRPSTQKYPDDLLNPFDRGEIQNLRSLFGEHGLVLAFLPLPREPEHDFFFQARPPRPTCEQVSKFTGFFDEEMLIEQKILNLVQRYKAQIKGKKFILCGATIAY